MNGLPLQHTRAAVQTWSTAPRAYPEIKALMQLLA